MTDRPRALIVLIAVFLLGGIVGTGGTYLWMKKSPAPERVEMPGRRPGPSQGRPRMQELLQLTPEQESQFGKIMAESRRQMEALRAEQQPKMEAIIADTNRKVMAILNKDQQKKFESMWKEMNSRGRRPSRGGHGMGPQPPR
jgi:uncharacterized membrane protein